MARIQHSIGFDSGLHVADSGFQALDSGNGFWQLDFGFQELNSGFQRPVFLIPQAEIPRIAWEIRIASFLKSKTIERVLIFVYVKDLSSIFSKNGHTVLFDPLLKR